MKPRSEVLQGTLDLMVDNNRKAKYYALTKAGRKQLRDETEGWQRMSAIINRLLETAG